MNRFVKHILLLLLFVAATTSCERRPLLEISNTRYVRVYIDEEIKILFQVGGLHRQPHCSIQDQLYLLMVLCGLYWFFPSAVLISSAISLTLSRRQY